MVSFFFRNFFSDFADILLFIVWGGVHKPYDEKLVTLYDPKNMI